MPELSPARKVFDDLVRRAEQDPGVVGLVLSGSHAREGMATRHSDFDIYVIVEEAGAPGWTTSRSALLDSIVATVDDFAAHAMPGTASEWNRYSFTHAQVLLDRRAGLISALVTEKGTLGSQQAVELARAALDGYANSLYRSAKDHRDGRLLAARLDAAESLPFLLTTVFALDRRVRPYNKFLRWELDRYPLPGEAWRAETLLPLLERVLSNGDMAAQRALFAQTEQLARAHGLGDVLDAWGGDLDLVRRPPSPPAE